MACLETKYYRTIAYELGRPSMISDEDSEQLREPTLDAEGNISTSRLEMIVHVAMTASHLRKAFKSPMISSTVAQAVDVDLNQCMSRLPPRLQLLSDDRLSPPETHPIMYLQDIRLLLHRHNLNPSCPMEARASGISECLNIAKNTARVLSRIAVSYPQVDGQGPNDTMQVENAKKWEDDMRLYSSTFTCLHVWRCMLFLTACEDYEGALLCATASKAIGKARAINNACGRYFEFFLNFCIDRQRTKSTPLEEDEGLMAYLSADLQGNPEQAWIWQDESYGRSASNSTEVDIQVNGDDDETEWNNWAVVIEELERLEEARKSRPALQQQASHSSTEGTGSQHLAPKLDTAVSPVQQLSPSNRMSIADLI